MLRSFTIILFSCFFLLTDALAQNTVGLLSYDKDRSFEGYNLIYPHGQPNVYLLNNCGEIVHVWTDDPEYRPGNTAYITEEGMLYKTKRLASTANDSIKAGGQGAIIEIRDWDNNLIWGFEMNDTLNRLHHDFAVMPNGNILAIAWEFKNLEETLTAGRDQAKMSELYLWPDWILEVDPVLDSIVWKWHAWDHLIQDFDETRENYGEVENHPGRIDLNYDTHGGHPDWLHANSIDYNPILDQIIVSIPYFDEIWIIDHSTTTEEAAVTTGGLSGRGGELLYRWGNPLAYRKGDASDQKLFFQHDAHWIDDFVDTDHPHYGKIAVFNNRVNPDYSTVNIINPPWNPDSWSYESMNNVFLPIDFDVTITHPEMEKLQSSGLSSFQVLPNENYLITAGRYGYSFELTPDNEIVWEYKTPLLTGNPVSQGTMLEINNNNTFRMDRYPADFAGFDGKDLSAKGWIELDPDETYCDRLTSVSSLIEHDNLKIYPNPATDFLHIDLDTSESLEVRIYNEMGLSILNSEQAAGKSLLDISILKEGIYFINISNRTLNITSKFVVHP